MAAGNFQDEDEAPLDPALLRVQARMRTMIFIAAGTLGLGLLAVLFAVVYRIVTLGDNAAPPVADPAAPVDIAREALALPEGARLIDTALDGSRLALTYEAGSGTIVVVVDTRNGAVVSTTRITE